MKRSAKILVALMGIALVGATVAQADYRPGGFGGYGSSRGYSSRSCDSFGGYGGGSFGGYGSGGYSRGWSGSSGRGASHYDYQPTQIQIQRGRVNIQPGHYDRDSSRHWNW